MLAELALPADSVLPRPVAELPGVCRLAGDVQQPVGRRPRLVLGVPDDEVEPQPDAQGTAVGGGPGPDLFQLLLQQVRGSPQVRKTSTCWAAISMPGAEEPPNQSGMCGSWTGFSSRNEAPAFFRS